MKAIALAIESSREDFRDFFFIAPCRRNVAAMPSHRAMHIACSAMHARIAVCFERHRNAQSARATRPRARDITGVSRGRDSCELD
ncbi:hypothetical protein [Variovorax sp. R-27]|uniref:hypothetical protein n=1 Tax=Variovorax sp. R-27 TaxID=3404058 RepID=UPI003CEAE30E